MSPAGTGLASGCAAPFVILLAAGIELDAIGGCCVGIEPIAWQTTKATVSARHDDDMPLADGAAGFDIRKRPMKPVLT